MPSGVNWCHVVCFSLNFHKIHTSSWKLYPDINKIKNLYWIFYHKNVEPHNTIWCAMGTCISWVLVLVFHECNELQCVNDCGSLMSEWKIAAEPVILLIVLLEYLVKVCYNLLFVVQSLLTVIILLWEYPFIIYHLVTCNVSPYHDKLEH